MRSQQPSNFNKSVESAPVSQQNQLLTPQSTYKQGILQLRSVLADPSLLITPSHALQLQKTIGNQAVAQLMKTRTQTQQRQTTDGKNESMNEETTAASSIVQRLKIYPKTIDGTDTDFKAEPQEINLEDESYENLCKYFAMREQQIRSGKSEKLPRAGLPERNLVFEDDEYVNMMVLIKAYEEGTGGLDAVPVVSCSEGQIKVTSAVQEGNFGGVSSCMTITIVMENGKKVLAHAGVEAPVTFAQIKAVVSTLGKVKAVKAAGVGWAWGTHLEPYSSDPISSDEKAFEQVLQGELGGQAEYQEMEGTIKVAADGTVSL